MMFPPNLPRCRLLFPGISGLIITVTVLTSAAVFANDPPIAANVAGLFVGKQRVVEGKVLKAQREEHTVRLRFGRGPRDFTVSLVIPLLSNFPPDPESTYLGKNVRVVGTIKEFRGVPEMIVRDATDIQIVDDATGNLIVPAASAGAPVTTAESTGLQGEIETLRERLRVLDERLRALEDGAPGIEPTSETSDRP
jgi:hypothetical protein